MTSEPIQVGDGGLPWPRSPLDSLFGGLSTGDLVFFGGKANSGKSWIAQQMARQQRKNPPDMVSMQDIQDSLKIAMTADTIISVSSDDKHAGTFQTVRYK